MAKLQREVVIAEALALLDEVGLDAFTTRGLAARLGVESAALYWHFRDKAALLAEMASAALVSHRALTTPDDVAAWPRWLEANTRSFRRALLAHRDGARLHAGTTPDVATQALIAPKIAYLVRAGFSRRHAGMALLAAGQFTLGCVLEAQARAQAVPEDDAAFEFGLKMLVAGLVAEIGARRRRAT